MKWVCYRIRTTPAAEDLIVDAMAQIGLTGAQIEDKVPLTAYEKEQIFTYDADDPVDDGVAFVSFYTERDDLKEDIRRALEDVRPFVDVGDGTVEVSVTDDAAWKDKWKQFFHSFAIDDLLVVPSWEEVPDLLTMRHIRHVLRIDPGCAFGTGAHETTQLALRALRREIDRNLAEARRPVVLDVGTGSGVLSIVALMTGARHTVATDVDPFVTDAVKENLAANAVDEKRMTFIHGDLTESEMTAEAVWHALSVQGETGFDLIVCNILPVVLKPLIPALYPYLKTDGALILSGILTEKEEEMRSILQEAHFLVREKAAQGEWISLTAGRA